MWVIFTWWIQVIWFVAMGLLLVSLVILWRLILRYRRLCKQMRDAVAGQYLLNKQLTDKLKALD